MLVHENKMAEQIWDLLLEEKTRVAKENWARAELIVLASFSQAFIEETVSI